MANNEKFKFIQNEISNNNIVLFMKGSTEIPQCGFSSYVVNILKKLNVAFHDIDVLMDHELRQAIKEFSDWPTIPQLYIKGEFIGGCDITKELYENGELIKMVREL